VRNSLLILTLWILAGCATKVASIYNYEVAKKRHTTFLLHHSEYDTLSADNNNLDNELFAIINENLRQRGLKSSALPDLYVSYIIKVHTSTESQRNNNYNNYNYANRFNSPYNYSTQNYKEGVLIIDIKNNDGKLIWQGSKTFKIRSKHNIRDSLPEICQEVISAYDPNH